MDWLELLIPLGIILFSLLGRMMGEKPQEPLPSPEEDGYEYEYADGEPAAAQRPRVEEVSGDAGEWEEWADTEEQPLEVLNPVEAVSMEPVAPVPVPVRPERAVPAAMPGTLELLRVDRKAEHQRLHQRVEAPPAPARRAGPIPALLRDPRDLRRAVLLSEVLGPPRALRELGEGGE